MKYTQQDLLELMGKLKRKEMTLDDFKKIEDISKFMSIDNPENPIIKFNIKPRDDKDSD